MKQENHAINNIKARTVFALKQQTSEHKSHLILVPTVLYVNK